MMEASNASAGSSKDCIGILQHIIWVDCGSFNEPIILFICQWKKWTDNLHKSTYICDV